AARYHVCGAVRGGEIVERPHGVDDQFLVRAANRVNTVVAMQVLGRLTRPDLDALRRAELVLPKYAVEHAEHEWVNGRRIERTGFSEQGVDALRLEAFEVVPARERGAQHLLEVGPLCCHIVRIEKAFDDAKAIAIECCTHLIDACVPVHVAHCGHLGTEATRRPSRRTSAQGQAGVGTHHGGPVALYCPEDYE